MEFEFTILGWSGNMYIEKLTLKFTVRDHNTLGSVEEVNIKQAITSVQVTSSGFTNALLKVTHNEKFKNAIHYEIANTKIAE